MTIREIIANGSGRAGSNGAWRVEDTPNCNLVLTHYGHFMLRWNPANPADPAVLDYSIGHGSVSDQGGMNTAFRVLGLPLYFSRAGGAEIREVR